MIRSVLAALLLVCAVAGPAAAQLPPPAAPIQMLDDGLLQIMHDGKAVPFAQRFRTLQPTVQKVFDLPEILQFSVGPAWSSFTAEQQDAALSEFLRFTTASYVSNFSSYNGERFEIEPATRAVAAEQVVTTHIIPGDGGTPARIDYVMRQGPAGWQVVDVLLDGTISRVAVQRSDFRSLVSGGAQALIDSLRKKVSDLSGGASLP